MSGERRQTNLDAVALQLLELAFELGEVPPDQRDAAVGQTDLVVAERGHLGVVGAALGDLGVLLRVLGQQSRRLVMLLN